MKMTQKTLYQDAVFKFSTMYFYTHILRYLETNIIYTRNKPTNDMHAIGANGV